MGKRPPAIPGTRRDLNGKYRRHLRPTISKNRQSSRSRLTTMDLTVAHQFEDYEQQQEASTLGMWLFLATEVLFFGGLFLGYTVYRSIYPAAYGEASRHLDIVFGTVNTAVLLCSSLTMAMSVRAAQMNHRKLLVSFLLVTMFLGVVFLGIKFYEYYQKYVEHLIPGAQFVWSGSDPKHAS